MKYLLSILFFLFIQLPALAGESTYRIETSYHHEGVESQTLETALLRDFTPYQGDLRLGFEKGETWIRLQIQTNTAPGARGQTSTAGPLVLRLGPYYLDDVTFYSKQDGQWTVQQGGDLFVKQRQNCPDDLYCFSMDLKQGLPITAYIKIKTDTVRMIQTAVIPAAEVLPAAISRINRMNVSLTLAVAVLVLSLAFLLLEHSPLLHMFFWFQASVVFLNAATTGVLAQWLPALSPETLNHLSNFGQVIRVTFMVLLGWVALRPCSPDAAYQKAVTVLLTICVINVFGVMTGHANWALTINFGVLVINSIVQLWGVYSGRNFPPKLRIILLTGWSVFLGFSSLGVYVSFGFLGGIEKVVPFQSIGDWRLNGVPIGIVVFWFVATEKSNRKIQKLKELQVLQMDAAQSNAYQEKLRERRELIDMLTHELKTPLGTIKFALASLKRAAKSHSESIDRVQHIDDSVNRMDAMIEHVALSNKIERHDARDSAEVISAQELMNVVMQEYRDTERFELHIQDGTFFHSDPHFLALIVENLVSNAVKYSTDGKIKITIANEAPTMTCFRISNRVANESLPDENRLFERYYRHPNFQHHPGMGIGLSLVHSAAEKMGASVSYKNRDEEVVFEVRMPH